MAKIILIEGNGIVQKAIETAIHARRLEDLNVPYRVVCFPDMEVPTPAMLDRESGYIIVNTQQREKYDGEIPIYPWQRITVQGTY